MRLVCPNCVAQYEIADGTIPVTGRDVQCANCDHIWFQDAAFKLSTDDMSGNGSHVVRQAIDPERQTASGTGASMAAASVFRSHRAAQVARNRITVAPEPGRSLPEVGQGVKDILQSEAQFSSYRRMEDQTADLAAPLAPDTDAADTQGMPDISTRIDDDRSPALPHAPDDAISTEPATEAPLDALAPSLVPLTTSGIPRAPENQPDADLTTPSWAKGAARTDWQLDIGSDPVSGPASSPFSGPVSDPTPDSATAPADAPGSAPSSVTAPEAKRHIPFDITAFREQINDLNVSSSGTAAGKEATDSDLETLVDGGETGTDTDRDSSDLATAFSNRILNAGDADHTAPDTDPAVSNDNTGLSAAEAALEPEQEVDATDIDLSDDLESGQASEGIDISRTAETEPKDPSDAPVDMTDVTDTTDADDDTGDKAGDKAPDDDTPHSVPARLSSGRRLSVRDLRKASGFGVAAITASAIATEASSDASSDADNKELSLGTVSNDAKTDAETDAATDAASSDTHHSPGTADIGTTDTGTADTDAVLMDPISAAESDQNSDVPTSDQTSELSETDTLDAATEAATDQPEIEPDTDNTEITDIARDGDDKRTAEDSDSTDGEDNAEESADGKDDDTGAAAEPTDVDQALTDVNFALTMAQDPTLSSDETDTLQVSPPDTDDEEAGEEGDDKGGEETEDTAGLLRARRSLVEDRKVLLPDVDALSTSLRMDSREREKHLRANAFENNLNEGRNKFWLGLVTVLVLFGIVWVLYLLGPALAETVPASAPLVDAFRSGVDRIIALTSGLWDPVITWLETL